MSELCYATTSRKRPTGLDILGGRLRDVPDWVSLRKLPDFCFLQKVVKNLKSCAKVVEVVKICGATEAHPWRGRRGAGGGGGGLTTSRIRAGVYSMPALNQKVIRKPDPLPLPH